MTPVRLRRCSTIAAAIRSVPFKVLPIGTSLSVSQPET